MKKKERENKLICRVKLVKDSGGETAEKLQKIVSATSRMARMARHIARLGRG